MNSVNTALLQAAMKDDIVAVRQALECGADVNARNDDGQTALHLAAMFNCKDVVRLLLASNADANAQDHEGDTPLHVAARRGWVEIVSFLLEEGADASLRNYWNKTALDYTTCQSVRNLLAEHVLEKRLATAPNNTEPSMLQKATL